MITFSLANRKSDTGLVELVAAPIAASASRYAVRVGGIALEFGDDFREDTLRRVIGLLHSC